MLQNKTGDGEALLHCSEVLLAPAGPGLTEHLTQRPDVHHGDASSMRIHSHVSQLKTSRDSTFAVRTRDWVPKGQGSQSFRVPAQKANAANEATRLTSQKLYMPNEVNELSAMCNLML